MSAYQIIKNLPYRIISGYNLFFSSISPKILDTQHMSYTEFIALEDILEDEDASFEFQHFLRLNDAEELFCFITDFQDFTNKSNTSVKTNHPSVEELSIMLDDIVQRYIVEDAEQILQTCPQNMLRITRTLYKAEQTKGLLMSLENLMTEIYSQVKTKYLPMWLQTEDFAYFFANAGESLERQYSGTSSDMELIALRRKSSIALDSTDLQVMAAWGAKPKISKTEENHEPNANVLKKRIDEKNAYFMGL
jgi:hypothetical protein